MATTAHPATSRVWFQPSPGTADPIVRLIGALVLLAFIVPAYEVHRFHGAYPAYVDTPSALYGIAATWAILGLVALALRLRSSGLAIAVLALGLLLLWPPLTARFALALPFELLRVGRPVLILAGIVASMAFRPSTPPGSGDATPVPPPTATPDGDGTPMTAATDRGDATPLPTLIIWAVLFLGIVGGFAAALILFDWQSIYGGDFWWGVEIVFFGVLSFAGYPAFYGLVRRLGPAACLALGYAGAVLAMPVMVAALGTE
jgi:hypothetical protein